MSKVQGKLVTVVDHDVRPTMLKANVWKSEPLKIGSHLFCVEWRDGTLKVLIGEQYATVASRHCVCVLDREALSGYRFCLTGQVTKYPKDAMKVIIEELGGEVVPAPKKATHFLRGDIANSFKLLFADENNLPVLDFEQFKELTNEAIIWL